MLAYLFLRIDYASGYDPPGSKFTRIEFFVTPAPSDDQCQTTTTTTITTTTTTTTTNTKINVLKVLRLLD